MTVIAFFLTHDPRILLFSQAYRNHLASVGKDPSDLDQTLALLKHTSSIIELFSSKHQVYHVNDPRLRDLEEALEFFPDWKYQVDKGIHFISEKWCMVLSQLFKQNWNVSLDGRSNLH